MKLLDGTTLRPNEEVEYGYAERDQPRTLKQERSRLRSLLAQREIAAREPGADPYANAVASLVCRPFIRETDPRRYAGFSKALATLAERWKAEDVRSLGGRSLRELAEAHDDTARLTESPRAFARIEELLQ